MKKFIYSYLWIFWLNASMALAGITINNKWYWIMTIPTIFFVELKMLTKNDKL
jgi:hypothetical protein